MTPQVVAPGRILVVDDSPFVRAVLVDQLTEQGHEVLEAESGAQALALVASGAPDVILLDVEMPELDGFAVLARLQEDPATRDLPVVFLTGRSSVDDVVEGLRHGAHDYLRKPFEPEELLARVSVALRVRRLQDALRARAAELDAVSRTDLLTGLPNRRDLEQALRAAAARALRAGEAMAVLLLDLDHFKRVNDTHGHDAGDAVLVEVARRLREVMRDGDTVGRWGGEEFLAVLPGSDGVTAGAVAERLRLAVSRLGVPIGDGTLVTVTLSVGAAGSRSADTTQLVRAADLALYDAKENGRNQVVVAG